jgi:hypothetical protein
MAHNFTDAQKAALEAIPNAMLQGVDLLCEAGIPLNNTADRHLAEGYVAIMALLYPDGIPAAEIDACCPCGQPIGHGTIH